MRLTRLSQRWAAEGGYRDLLRVAIPLILSTGAYSIQHYVDRMFLTWYSPTATAASMPAGILGFTVLSLFVGTAGYAGTFVSQYHGAGRPERVGPAVWQGAWLALIAAGVNLALIPLAGPIFDLIGHEPAVRRLEVTYFKILCLGAGFVVGSSALAGFFSGLGRTAPVMWVNLAATAVNLVLDYLMIFGKGGFPEMGIAGAAIATVISSVFGFVVYLILLARPSCDREFHTLRGWRPERELFGRLLYYGLPSGAQFFLDVAGFAVFISLVGQLGPTALAASTIAFNINTLAFMPMIGIGIAVSVLVGQRLGRNDPECAARGVWSGFHLTFAYMATISALYVLIPDLFLAPFAARATPGEFDEIRRISVVLLRFVAVYSLFDGMNIVFASGVKGAGDTRFVMMMIVVVSSLLLVLPTLIVVKVLHLGLYAAWTVVTVYVIALGFAFLARFLGGKWKSMRVIEEIPQAVPPALPETPPVAAPETLPR